MTASGQGQTSQFPLSMSAMSIGRLNGAGAKPPPRPGIQPGSQEEALGQAEAEARYITSSGFLTGAAFCCVRLPRQGGPEYPINSVPAVSKWNERPRVLVIVCGLQRFGETRDSRSHNVYHAVKFNFSHIALPRVAKQSNPRFEPRRKVGLCLVARWRSN
jgi:hypothetical protein